MTAHPQDSANITSSRKPSLTSLPPPKLARPLPLGNSAPRISHPEHSMRSAVLATCSLFLYTCVYSRRWRIPSGHGQSVYVLCPVPSTGLTPRPRVRLERGLGWRRAGSGRQVEGKTEGQTWASESGCGWWDGFQNWGQGDELPRLPTPQRW